MTQPHPTTVDWEKARERVLTTLNLYAMGIMSGDYDYTAHLEGFTDRIMEDFQSELDKAVLEEGKV
jgi:hypothetical protein